MNLDNDMEQERQEGSDDFRYDIQNSLNASEKRKNAMNELYEWIESSVFAVILILLVFTFFVRTAFVVDGAHAA